MIIIIEGQRATGKTTLSQALVEEFGFKRMKATRGENPWKDMHDWLDSIDANDKWVVDRFHLTEFVMRKADVEDHHLYSRTFLPMLKSIQNRIERMDGLVVVLECNESIRQARLKLKERQDENNPSLLNRFWTYISEDFGHLTINTSQHIWRDNVRLLSTLIFCVCKGKLK